MNCIEEHLRSAIRSICVCFVLIVASDCISTEKAQKIDELMEKYQEYRDFYGVVLVAEQGRVIYQKAFGYASLEWQVPNAPDTRFALASVSKPFAAALAVLAAQAGELSLDDRVSDYLPEYPKEKGDKVTIRHLLLHTSGIPIGVPPQYDRIDLYQEAQCNRLTRKQYLQLLSDQEFLFEPGTKFQYSNYGYSLLAMVLEKAAGKTYPQLLQERICAPLGMQHTCTDYGTEIINNRATRYYYWFARGPELAPLLGQASSIGCADIYSTVGDLYLFDQALYSESFISGEYREQMFTPGLVNNGLGWIIEDQHVGRNGRTARVVKRAGGAEGTKTCVLRYVEDRHLIVILCNYTEPYFLRTRLARPMQDIAPNIAAILYDEEYDLPKKSAAYEMLLSLRANGRENTESAFRKELDNDSSEYEFSTEEFHWAGFSLYNFRQAKEALPLFDFAEQHLDMESYVDALGTNRHANFLFDYGRSYMQLKEWQKAISKLEQAISVDTTDPHNCWAYIAHCKQQMNTNGG